MISAWVSSDVLAQAPRPPRTSRRPVTPSRSRSNTSIRHERRAVVELHGRFLLDHDGRAHVPRDVSVPVRSEVKRRANADEDVPAAATEVMTVTVATASPCVGRADARENDHQGVEADVLPSSWSTRDVLGLGPMDEPARADYGEEGRKAMHMLVWILFGLVVGVVAKFLMPGRDPGGFVITIVLGIVGAFVGGFIGRTLGWYRDGDPVGFFMAVLGAIAVLAIYRVAVGRSA